MIHKIGIGLRGIGNKCNSTTIAYTTNDRCFQIVDPLLGKALIIIIIITILSLQRWIVMLKRNDFYDLSENKFCSSKINIDKIITYVHSTFSY